jgi:hypothetical protein
VLFEAIILIQLFKFVDVVKYVEDLDYSFIKLMILKVEMNLNSLCININITINFIVIYSNHS